MKSLFRTAENAAKVVAARSAERRQVRQVSRLGCIDTIMFNETLAEFNQKPTCLRRRFQPIVSEHGFTN